MTAGTTFRAPKVRSRLRTRPPERLRNAKGLLYGVIGIVGLVVVLLIAVFFLLSSDGALDLLIRFLPAVGIAAVAFFAARSFRDRTKWSFFAATGIGLFLAGFGTALILWVVLDRSGLDGNSGFFVVLGALLMVGIGLPLATNMAGSRKWFFSEQAGPAVVTADELLAEVSDIVALEEGMAQVAAEPAKGGTLISVRGLKKHFPIYGGILRRQVGTVYAVDGVDFDIRSGEVFALVGESGCGKTTLGRTLLQLTPPTAGKVVFDGYELGDVEEDDMRPLRRRMQIIFQDPFGSLNPRMPVSDIIGEGLFAQGVTDRKERDKRVEDALEVVGLRRDYTRRFPHEFSGGQRQRIGVARALALNPDFIVCDEPVSALDVSIQSQVLNLLLDLKRDFNLTYLFISHNLSVVEYFSDRIGVMYLGKIAELGTVEDLYRDPRHPYTVALLSAIPEPDPRRRKKRLVLKGDVPSPAAPPSGCRFHTRCWLREQLGNPEICATTEPELRSLGGADHRSACHFAEQINDATVERVAATQSVVETAAADPA